MKLRQLVTAAVTVAAATATTALVPGAASAAPPDSTNAQSYSDTADDAPSAVDITAVNVYRTATEYRASVSFSDLRAQKGNRWYVSFSSTGFLRGTGAGTGAAPSGILPSLTGNVVEYRITPGGTRKSLAYSYSAGSATPDTCQGVRATPDWQKSKIVFSVSATC